MSPDAIAAATSFDGDPTTDITATRRLSALWRGGQRCDLDGYVGSDDETAGITALQAQTQRVIDAARELWPEALAEWSNAARSADANDAEQR